MRIVRWIGAYRKPGVDADPLWTVPGLLAALDWEIGNGRAEMRAAEPLWRGRSLILAETGCRPRVGLVYRPADVARVSLADVWSERDGTRLVASRCKPSRRVAATLAKWAARWPDRHAEAWLAPGADPVALAVAAPRWDGARAAAARQWAYDRGLPVVRVRPLQ